MTLSKQIVYYLKDLWHFTYLMETYELIATIMEFYMGICLEV